MLRMLNELLSTDADFSGDIGRFWDPEGNKSGTVLVNKPDGVWDKVAENMVLELGESTHPIFRATTPLEGGELRSKGKGMKFIHFSGSGETTEILPRIVNSVDQLSMYGAAAELCEELSKNSDSMVTPTEVPIAHSNA